LGQSISKAYISKIASCGCIERQALWAMAMAMR